MLYNYDRSSIKNDVFGDLEVFVEPNGKIWFLGIQAATILGYKNPNDAIYKQVPPLEKEFITLNEKDIEIIIGPAYEKNRCRSYQNRKYAIITEMGLNFLIGSSRKFDAWRFKEWLYGEVLPSIRAEGKYRDTGRYGDLMYNMLGGPVVNYRNSQERDVAIENRKTLGFSLAATLHTRREFAEVTNAIYIAMFGYTAKELRKMIGLPKGKLLRDYFVQDVLASISYIEGYIHYMMTSSPSEEEFRERFNAILRDIHIGSTYHRRDPINNTLPFRPEYNDRSLREIYFKPIEPIRPIK